MAAEPKALMLAWTMTLARGDDRVLNAGGNTQIDDLPKHIAVKAYLPPGQAVAVPGVG